MSPATPRQYLIVEDLDDTRRWLIDMVRQAFGVEPASAATLAEARAWLATERRNTLPLVALIDLGLPDGHGAELIAEINTVDPDAMLIVTTIFDDDASVVRALAAGAKGYLLKDRDRAELGRRLQEIEAGEVPISPSIARRLLSRFRETELTRATITPRETEVLALIGRGLTLQETAALLKISPQTAATHVKTIYRKLDISSRAEAALEARHRGLA